MIKITKNTFEVLSALFNSRNLNLNAIARKSEISVMGISKIIRKLRDIDIVTAEKIGKSLMVNLKPSENNLEILALTEKYILEKFLKKHSKLKSLLSVLKEKTDAECVIIFGSYASGEETNESDIDMLIINSRKNTIKNINQASVLTPIEINPIFITKKDFVTQIKKGHRLYTEILNGKRILIKGEYDFWKTVLNIFKSRY